MKQKYIFIIIIVISMLLTGYFQYKHNIFMKQVHETKINILTRSGRRDDCFKLLRNSIEKQSHTNWKHLISDDTIDSKFLVSYENVHKVKFVKKGKKYQGTDHRHCPYNVYLNTLLEHTDDGWIIIIDDDALLMDKNFLLNIAKECCKADTNDVILYDIYAGKDKNIMPIDIENQIKNGLVSGKVDMNGFVFHKTNKIRFDDKCSGDYHFLNNSKNEGYNLKYVRLPKIGVWANYKGWMNGKDIVCELPNNHEM
jgi:hypothetical protein